MINVMNKTMPVLPLNIHVYYKHNSWKFYFSIYHSTMHTKVSKHTNVNKKDETYN